MNVSRETQDRLGHFANLVRKWSPKINLVSKADLQDLENRHIADSLQLFHVKQNGWMTWTDFGSGGGFPGIVAVIVAAETNPEGTVKLVESDKRKATFLRTAIRELNLTADVIAERIEDLPDFHSDVISARALAPLPKLISLTHRFIAPDGIALFPKGINWKTEADSACQEWSFNFDVVQSTTASGAVILKLKEVRRV